MLDDWVAAKRDRDFTTSDRLRDELRAHGVDAEKARPDPRGRCRYKNCEHYNY